MRAAIFAAPGRLELQDVQRSLEPGAFDVLIEVEACGICGSDLHVLEDPPGHPATLGVVLGHEFVGRVVAIGPEVRHPGIGTRVVVESTLPCLTCSPCRAGMRAQCEDFTSFGIFRDGGLADYVTVPARVCHAISDSLPSEVAALAEPLACVVNGFRLARPMIGDRVCVIGGGAAGQMFTALYRHSGASDILLVEPSQVRRAAGLAMGASESVAPGDIADVHQGTFDIVIDAAGSQLPQAMALARGGATIMLYGMNANADASVRQYDITRNELRLVGAYAGSEVMPIAVRILERSGIDFTPILTVLPYEELPEALDQLHRQEITKAVIRLRDAGGA